MPSGFYILLNYFLRVDGVVIRMNGTRFHYEVGKNYIIKEFTAREAAFAKIRHVSVVTWFIILCSIWIWSVLLQIPPSVYTVPAEIEKHLTVILKTTQKVFFEWYQTLQYVEKKKKMWSSKYFDCLVCGKVLPSSKIHFKKNYTYSYHVTITIRSQYESVQA